MWDLAGALSALCAKAPPCRGARALGELLQRDNDGVQPWLHPRARRPPPRRNANDGDAHDDVAAAGVDVDLLRECMETVSRESAILRRETTALAEATAAGGALAGAQHRRAQAVLVERAAALRETKARHAAAIELLHALRTSTVWMAFEDVSTQQREPRLAGPPRPHPRSN